MGKMLRPEQYPTDMTELCQELLDRKIPYKLKEHPIAKEGAKELLGYSPAGDWQVLIGDKFSVIRGMVSFGDYEIMNIGGGGNGWADDPERFSTAKELVEALEALSSESIDDQSVAKHKHD